MLRMPPRGFISNETNRWSWCSCSAGLRHRQLVKSGNDDLRQDAVMQQLFGLINEVLAHSPATAKRRLRIVTYKVRSCFALSSYLGDQHHITLCSDGMSLMDSVPQSDRM